MSVTVPSVDLAPFLHGDDQTRRAVASAVDGACRDVGFLALTGHGVDHTLRDRMLASVTEFFALPLEAKLRLSHADKRHNRGYSALGHEALAYSLGVASPPDLFEAFNVGTTLTAAQLADANRASAHEHFFAPNEWPPELPTMAATWLAWFDACHRLATVLDEVFAAALDLAPEFFRCRTSRAPNLLRVNHYERRAEHPPPEPGQMRMGAHTDYGLCTILLADPVPGLQIHVDGAWHDVVPEPGTLLVNLGDLLAQWTNDRWRSTLHRVVPPPPGVDGPFTRRSLAFFHEVDPDVLVETIPCCIDAEHPARYPPVIAADHLITKQMSARVLELADTVQTSITDRDVLLAPHRHEHHHDSRRERP